jgi:hypothetical protein
MANGAFVVLIGTGSHVAMAVHALSVESVHAGRDEFLVRPVLFSHGAGSGVHVRLVVVAAQTVILGGEGVPVFGREPGVEFLGVAGPARHRLLGISGIVVVTVDAVEAVILGVGGVRENDPAAAVVEENAGREIGRAAGQPGTDPFRQEVAYEGYGREKRTENAYGGVSGLHVGFLRAIPCIECFKRPVSGTT